MSKSNVELVKQLYELFARRDMDSVFPDHAASDIEIRVPPLYPDAPATFRGRDGLEEWIAMIDEVWDVWRFEPEHCREAESTVVVSARLIAEGHASGVHLEREVAHVWKVENGRVTSIQAYLDPAEALEAAGLSE